VGGAARDVTEFNCGEVEGHLEGLGEAVGHIKAVAELPLPAPAEERRGVAAPLREEASWGGGGESEGEGADSRLAL
jgi:hypothetical protein